MSNVNAPFGLRPVMAPPTGLLREEFPMVAESLWPGIADMAYAIGIGDPVDIFFGGLIQRVYNAVQPILGVVVGVSDPGGKPASHVPKSVDDEWWKYRVSVCTDPQQRYVIQEDSVGLSISIGTGPAYYADLAVSPLPTLNSFNGLSQFMLDSSSVNYGGPSQLQIIGKYQALNNDIGDYCKWIVRISNHQMG